MMILLSNRLLVNSSLECRKELGKQAFNMMFRESLIIRLECMRKQKRKTKLFENRCGKLQFYP